MPIAATQHTAAGARAFAEFFIRTIDWAYATTSTTYMRHYFQRGCVGCSAFADAIDRAMQQGHHFIGDRFDIVEVSPATGTATKHYTVSSNVNAAEVVDRQGKFVAGQPALSNFRENVGIEWIRENWVVLAMNRA